MSCDALTESRSAYVSGLMSVVFGRSLLEIQAKEKGRKPKLGERPCVMSSY